MHRLNIDPKPLADRAGRQPFACERCDLCLPIECQRPTPERHAIASTRASPAFVRSLAGSGSTMFSAHELPFLRPDELEQLRAYSDGGYARLSPEQRERLRTNLHLVLVTLSDADYARVANFVPKSVEMQPAIC